jgi:peptidoglycan hydrolase CwlO-like protein
MSRWSIFTDADRDLLGRIAAGIDTLITKMEELMSEDAAVAAAAADLTTQAANLTTAVTALQALITAVQTENVSPATVTALQNAQAAVDAIAGTASADVTADQPPAPATPPATPPAT